MQYLVNQPGRGHKSSRHLVPLPKGGAINNTGGNHTLGDVRYYLSISPVHNNPGSVHNRSSVSPVPSHDRSPSRSPSNKSPDLQ